MEPVCRWRRWIVLAVLPILAGFNSCITVNYTLKPDTLQFGDVVIIGRWERFDRKGYQPAEKTGWGSHCVGDVERPEVLSRRPLGPANARAGPIPDRHRR